MPLNKETKPNLNQENKPIIFSIENFQARKRYYNLVIAAFDCPPT